MPQATKTRENRSQRGTPYNSLEPLRATIGLATSKNRVPKINQYREDARIGKGRHGEVFLCHYQGEVDRKVAIKIVKRSNPRDRIRLLRKRHQQSETALGTERIYPMSSTENSIRKEIAIMKKCRHPNVVQLFEVVDDPQQDKIYLIMEYCAGGPLQWTTESKEPILRLEQIRRIMRDVIVGLEYLHSLGIVHRDIKPHNLLYSRDRTMVKIIDFGVSHYNFQRSVPHFTPQSNPEDVSIFPSSDLQKTLGTPNFLAPEVVWFDDIHEDPSKPMSNRSFTNTRGKKFMKVRPPITEALDIWALGITFYCLLFGRTPFNAPSSNDNVHHGEWLLYNQICTQDWEADRVMTVERIPTGGRQPRDPISDGYAVVSLLDLMLRKDPLTRETASNLKRHPWILTHIINPQEWLQMTSPFPVPPVPQPVLPTSRWLRYLGRRMSRILHQ